MAVVVKNEFSKRFRSSPEKARQPTTALRTRRERSTPRKGSGRSGRAPSRECAARRRSSASRSSPTSCFSECSTLTSVEGTNSSTLMAMGVVYSYTNYSSVLPILSVQWGKGWLHIAVVASHPALAVSILSIIGTGYCYKWVKQLDPLTRKKLIGQLDPYLWSYLRCMICTFVCQSRPVKWRWIRNKGVALEGENSIEPSPTPQTKQEGSLVFDLHFSW